MKNPIFTNTLINANRTDYNNPRIGRAGADGWLGIGRDNLRGLLGERPSQAVADLAHRVWVDFISRATPGWAPYDTGHRVTALLSDAVRPAADPAGDERAVWEGIR